MNKNAAGFGADDGDGPVREWSYHGNGEADQRTGIDQGNHKHRHHDHEEHADTVFLDPLKSGLAQIGRTIFNVAAA